MLTTFLARNISIFHITQLKEDVGVLHMFLTLGSSVM